MLPVEVAAYLAKGAKRLRTAVVLMVKAIGNNSNCTIVGHKREQFAKALSYYAEHDDKEWRLVDCASMILMKERTIWEVFVFRSPFCTGSV
jgi:predicted nucleic acid-binding protein